MGNRDRLSHKAYGKATAVVLLNGYDVPPPTCLLCLRPWIMTALGPGQENIFLWGQISAETPKQSKC